MWNFNSLLKTSLKGRLTLCNYQSVRWLRPRKPFWLGLAKSKMFVLPKERKRGTEEEEAEYKRLQNIYKSQMKCLLKFIRTDDPLLKETSQQSFAETQLHLQLLKKMDESWLKNESFNQESAELRKKRLEAANEKLLLDIEEKIKKKSIEMDQINEKLNKAVRIEKEQFHTYITHENLDEAIEKCLNNIVDYNFAIDLSGNKIEGKEPYVEKPVQVKIKQ